MANSKISENITISDTGQITVHQRHDGNQMLRDAEYARQHTENAFGSDNKLICQVDPAMIGNWLREAGVKWTDHHAANEVIKKKITSGEFADLRVWQGKY